VTLPPRRFALCVELLHRLALLLNPRVILQR
jgi:hypothetical protein